MIGIYDVVKRPLVTERSMTSLDRANTYVFEVHPKANKVQIRNAVERLFKVKVLSVNTQNVRGKTVRRKSGEVTRRHSAFKPSTGSTCEAFSAG